jgi:hypothetical protein
MSFSNSCLRGDLEARIIGGNCLIISLDFAKNKKLGGRFGNIEIKPNYYVFWHETPQESIHKISFVQR